VKPFENNLEAVGWEAPPAAFFVGSLRKSSRSLQFSAAK
jgi:hypothetical protein